jgi:hypothetical protein
MDAGAYAERLAAEAEFWGRDAERRAREVPPDWEHQRQLRDNAFVLAPRSTPCWRTCVPG